MPQPKSVRFLPVLILAFTGCQKQTAQKPLEPPVPAVRGVRNGNAISDKAVGMLNGAAGVCTGTTLCVNKTKTHAVVLTVKHCPHAYPDRYAIDDVVTPGFEREYGTIVDRREVGSIKTFSGSGTDGFALLKVRLDAGKDKFTSYPYLAQDPTPPKENIPWIVIGYGESLNASDRRTPSRRGGSVKSTSSPDASLLRYLANPHVPCARDSGLAVTEIGAAGQGIRALHVSRLLPKGTGNVDDVEGCRVAIGGYGVSVAPYYGDIMDAANSLVPSCLGYDPAEESLPVRIHLGPGSGLTPKGDIILTTDPQGESPAGDHCEWSLPDWREARDCVRETRFSPVRRRITFTATQRGLENEMAGGYWIINDRRYEGHVAKFDFLGNVAVDATYFPIWKAMYDVSTGWQGECQRIFGAAGAYVDDSGADPAAMADQIKCFATWQEGYSCSGRYLEKKGMSLMVRDVPEGGRWKWASAAGAIKCPCEGTAKNPCAIPGQKGNTFVACEVVALACKSPPTPTPEPSPAPSFPSFPPPSIPSFEFPPSMPAPPPPAPPLSPPLPSVAPSTAGSPTPTPRPSPTPAPPTPSPSPSPTPRASPSPSPSPSPIPSPSASPAGSWNWFSVGSATPSPSPNASSPNPFMGESLGITIRRVN